MSTSDTRRAWRRRANTMGLTIRGLDGEERPAFITGGTNRNNNYAMAYVSDGFAPIGFPMRWQLVKAIAEGHVKCITVRPNKALLLGLNNICTRDTAPMQGFEPQPPGPEPGVLPLDDTGMVMECKHRVTTLDDRYHKAWRWRSSVTGSLYRWRCGWQVYVCDMWITCANDYGSSRLYQVVGRSGEQFIRVGREAQ